MPTSLLPLFLHPLTWCLALFLAAFFLCRHTRLTRALLLSGILLLFWFGSDAGSHTLLVPLESPYPDIPPPELPAAQAIVLLGGTVHLPGDLHPHSAIIDPSDRILEAFRLYRAGRAPLILCSGGGFSDGPSEAEVMARMLTEWGLPESAIVVETRSHSTRENAIFSREILERRGIRKILLVTSAAHLRRALATFRKAGFEVTPAPADYRTGWGIGTGLLHWLPNAKALTESDFVVKEWLGFWVYRLRGWA